MIRIIRENKLIAAVAIAGTLNLITSSIFAWTSWEARGRICNAIEDTFDGYTENLITASGGPSTPEREARIAYFRQLTDELLADCH